MTKLLKGDSCLSLYAEAVCYLASLALLPGVIFAFTSRTDVSLSYISEISLLLILLPFVVSRFLRGYRLDTVSPRNLGFFLVTYTVIGLNTQGIFGDVTAVALIAFVRTFVIGAVVFLSHRWQARRRRKESLALCLPPSRTWGWLRLSS